MPAERLRETPTAVRQYDIGGQDSDKIPEFVRHVGLSLEAYEGLTLNSGVVAMVHMGPPLSSDNADDAASVQTVATAELSADEILQMQVFIDELISEYEAENARPRRQYIICPHVAEPNEQFPFRRFNCAGFAVEAYRDAGIELILLKEGSLPRVSLETLKQAYPDSAKQLDNPKVRKAFCLTGDGPWPVLLAGYVVNAMSRNTTAIRTDPYIATVGDEFFPRRSLGGA